MARALYACVLVLLLAETAVAEVVRIDVRRRDDWGTHERVIGRVHFAIDPRSPANRSIADIDLAPTNADGKVEFSSDVLFFRPKDPQKARGSAFIEIVNRGRDQSLGILSGASQRDLSPEAWDLGDRFLLEHGFAVAFIGWQFGLRPSQGLTFQAPAAPVTGPVRESYIEADGRPGPIGFAVTYCATALGRDRATLTFRARIDAPPQPLARQTWQFAEDGCSVLVSRNAGIGIYEAVYESAGSPVAGLGLAAVRDFASYLRYGTDGAVLRETPAALKRVIGYGYSQSGRFLREFVRDGFNADERGRRAFDAMMISSAGAGGGSFNHRFAMPGQAGNSVLSILRPVDLPPFTDEELLARAQAAGVTPKIFYTFSSTEYWARAGSLTHTNDAGLADAPLAPTSRLYFLAGTPHSLGSLPLTRGTPPRVQQFVNMAQPRWVTRALLLNLDSWARLDYEPPASQYPSISKGELVPLAQVRFPNVPSFPFTTYMPQVWRMDYGPEFETKRLIAEPPRILAPYRVLVPQVNADGNDVAGIRMPEVAVPLGTHTGWNISVPSLRNLGYLSGLLGAFEPFAATREQRSTGGDERLSIAERYTGRSDYLAKVRRVTQDLAKQRFLLESDVPSVVRDAERLWAAVVEMPR